MATIATVYITAGLTAQDSAGTLPAASAHVIATVYITAGLPANDYEAAGGDPEGSLISGKLIRGGLLMHGVLNRS
jgi:hypothetical protein